MNTVASGVCAAHHPMALLFDGLGPLERIRTYLSQFAIAQDALRRGWRRTAGLGVARAGGYEEPPAEVPRRRMAILIGDVAGYSRLIEADDVGTVARLRLLRRALIDPAAALFRAVVIRHTADAILLAFDDTVDAIGCAITLQSFLYRLNEDAPETQGIRFRMGLSVGEILLIDNDIHGTGVNIAARLEALAGAGEIYLCERAVDEVRHVLPLAFESVGARRLHNISTRVRTFRIAAKVIAGIARERMRPAKDGLQPAERDACPIGGADRQLGVPGADWPRGGTSGWTRREGAATMARVTPDLRRRWRRSDESRRVQGARGTARDRGRAGAPAGADRPDP